MLKEINNFEEFFMFYGPAVLSACTASGPGVFTLTVARYDARDFLSRTVCNMASIRMYINNHVYNVVHGTVKLLQNITSKKSKKKLEKLGTLRKIR